MSEGHMVHNHNYDPGCWELQRGARLQGRCLLEPKCNCQRPLNAFHLLSCPESADSTPGHVYPVIESDPVNSPDHYRWLPIEAIEVTEHFNFCLGNALKYILRADHKGKPIEDLKKARWYIDREIARRVANDKTSD